MTFTAFLNGLFSSKLFWCIVVAYFVTHIIKFFVHHYRFKQWSIAPFFDTGGMPSGHTALTTALTVAIGFETGPSILFIACAVFTIIVIRDSYGVRKSVSDQADLLNALLSEMKVYKKAKIVLGHTPLQVAAGFLLGLIIGFSFYLL
jgi:uncharacterized protein